CARGPRSYGHRFDVW
nr:immunoglobulin heavy chain junction region [Macaca mulatta]MPN83334.1 immunoglobulin heavy chain junction region [Macaca mulatta]MPN83377.1 immunoglobulin heavy chain junction region [Macaca mulatta]MPN83388.1 immunoglobulin heavy chain junction region [Macaca mulatta]MPN83412.1 immunoglobulin heavy chain junction region [Macaca mulatta]